MDESVSCQIISNAIKTLDEPYYEVLMLYYGLNNTPCFSFQEISRQIGKPVTVLERMEKGAIRKLRRTKTVLLISKAVQMADSDIWQALAEENNVVYKVLFSQQVSKKLPGELIVGIKCLYDSVKPWFDNHASGNNIAWFRSNINPIVVLKTVGQLKRMHKKTSLPLPFSKVADILKIDGLLLQQALALSINKIGVYRDYISMLPITSRTIRVIRIHLLMQFRYSDVIVPLEQLYREYFTTYSDDTAGLNDFIHTMNDHPHMFLKIGHIGWFCFLKNMTNNPYKNNGKSNDLLEPDKDKHRCFYKHPWKKTNTMDLLKNIVASKGMGRIVEIQKKFNEISKSTVKPHNIGPIINASSEFVQISPAVFALRKTQNHIDLVNADPDYLLTYRDIRWYILSRYAGEAMNSYPLWTPAMERKWCHGVKRNDNNKKTNKLFQSLMSIAEPDLWPADDDEKKHWLNLKKWNGYYYFKSDSKHQVWHKIPPLIDILKLSIYLSLNGSMNWIRINRVTGYYIFDQHSITALALLIAFDILEPADHWQKPHKTGTKAGWMKDKLLNAISEGFSVQWDSSIGQELEQYLHGIDGNKKMGWVTINDLKLLAAKLKTNRNDKNLELTSTNKEKIRANEAKQPKQLDIPFGKQ